MEQNILRKTFKELTNQELYEILHLRNEVFVQEQKIVYVDTDFYDQISIHYLLYDGDKLVSYLRVIPQGTKFVEYALSRIATDDKYRNKGLATKLIKASMQDLGAPIRISGQAYLKVYYERLGFVVVKGPYIEDDLPHYEMLFTNK